MSVKEAEEIFENFFKSKPEVKKFIDKTHSEVKKNGYVDSLHGFRRNLRDVYSQDRTKQGGALRQSVNTKIQGAGAYLTNMSVIIIQKVLEQRSLQSKLILTVHDSIVADCPPEEVHEVAEVSKYVMENLPIDWLFIQWEGKRTRFPIEIDVEIGVNYNDMVDYNEEELEQFNLIANYCKYYSNLSNVGNYKSSGLITEEKAEELVSLIESRLPDYQQAN